MPAGPVDAQDTFEAAPEGGGSQQTLAAKKLSIALAVATRGRAKDREARRRPSLPVVAARVITGRVLLSRSLTRRAGGAVVVEGDNGHRIFAEAC